MKQLPILIALFILGVECAAQSFPYELNNRVDTTNAEVREILQLWLGYLDSKPDSIYDNPYWNRAEKEKYKQFDFTSRLMYQFPSQQLLQYFRPFVLSIEKREELYEIRTLFYAEGLSGYHARSNPWNLLRVFAIKEEGQWKLMNALPYLTRNWNRTTVGKITYLYDCNYHFNEQLAQKSVAFCDSLASVFDVSYEPFEYYITANPDELGQILGFDFSFGGIAGGLAMFEARKLFSGNGTEWYPHEFVHMVLGIQQHPMVSEGVATWIGGANIHSSFSQNARSLARAVAGNDTVTVRHVLSRQWGWQYNAFYTTGGIWCDLIYRRKGITGLKLYLEQAPSGDEEYFLFLLKQLGIKEKELDKLWRQELARWL